MIQDTTGDNSNINKKIKEYQELHNDMPWYLTQEEIDHQNYHVEENHYDPKCVYCIVQKCGECQGSGMKKDLSEVCGNCRGTGRKD